MAWDLLDEDCSGIGDWNDLDAGNGVSEVSPAGQFRMDGNAAHVGGVAERARDIGSFPNIFTFELKLYHDKLGTMANTDFFALSVDKSGVRLGVVWDTDGIHIYDGDAYNEVGTDLVKHAGSAEWQTWRFVIDMTVPADAVCDLYLTDSTHEFEKVGTAIDCSYTIGGNEGIIDVSQYCRTVSDQLTHIDHIRAITGEAVIHEIICTADGQSTASATVKVTRKVAGTSDGQTTAGVAVKVTREVSGGADATSTAAAAVKVLRKVSGVADGQSTASCTITTSVYIAGTADAQSTAQATVTVRVFIIGTADAQAGADATVKVLRKIICTADAQSTATMSIIGFVYIECTADGQTTATCALIVTYAEIPPAMHEDLIDPYGDMGAWIWLVEIVIPTQATQRIARNPASVVYGVTTFAVGNFEPPGQIPLVGDGSIPRIQLRVAQDGTGTLENIINATKGGENGTVKIIRTCEKYFNSPVKALERTYDILIAGSDPQWVTFSLGIPSPLTQRIPLWSYSSKVCPLATPSLFKGPRCQYAGEDATCTGLLEDCRDNKNNAEHWGAEIGLDPNAVRV